MAQKIGIRTTGLKQLVWNPIHCLEAIVAEDNSQIFVREDERARHVVQRDMELRLLHREGLLSPLFLRNVRHHGHGAAQRRPSAENAVDPAVRRAVFEALA